MVVIALTSGDSADDYLFCGAMNGKLVSDSNVEGCYAVETLGFSNPRGSFDVK